MMNKDKPGILFLGSGPFALDRRDENDKYKYFSMHYQCYFLTPVNKATGKMTGMKDIEVQKNFTLIPFAYFYNNSLIRNILTFYNVISKSLWSYFIKKRNIEFVISSNPLLHGLYALIIAKCINAKAIIEINGNFESAFKYGRGGAVEIRLLDKIKEFIAIPLIKFTTNRADKVKLLYGNQLDFTKNERLRSKCIAFPNFTSVKPFLDEVKRDDKFILSAGFPWYLKGMDLLINAFNKISDNFPEYRLKIVGHCPEGREYYENLAGNNEHIELCNAVPHVEIVQLMTKCSLFVLASRTEAMGRVLLEAMASRKPIVASNVDGIPTIVKDGFNGLLFERENIDELSEKIESLLSDNIYAEQLARNGYSFVKEKCSGRIYINNYKSLLSSG